MEKKISLFSATLMNINMMIGVGAFFGPSIISKHAGAFGFITWLLVALLFSPVVASLVRASKLVPGGAGVHSYAEGLLGNHEIATISSIAYTAGFMSVAALQIDCVGDEIAKHFGVAQPHGVLLAAVVALGLHLLGLRIVAVFQNASSIFKLSPMALVIVSIPFTAWVGLKGASLPGLSGFALSFPIALFGYWGFESATSISDKVAGGVGKSVAIGFAATAALYSLFHLGLVKVIGAGTLADGGPAAAAYAIFGTGTLGKIGSILLTSAISAAYFTSMISVITTVSSLSLSLVYDANPENFSKIATAARMKAFAAAAIFISTVAALLLNSKEVLTALSNIGVVTGFIVTSVGVLRNSISSNNPPWILISSLGVLSSVGFLVISFFSSGNTLYSRLVNTAVVVALVILLRLMLLLKSRLNLISE